MTALCLVLGWGIVWLAAWPGYFCYDTEHLVRFLESGTLESTQPVLHTLILGGVVRAGTILFGSWNGGVALYAAMQLAGSVTLGVALVRFLARRRAPRWLTWATVAFLALDPAISMLACCSSKDVPFTMLLVAFGIIVYDVVQRGDVGRRRLAIMTVVAFALLAYRNNAVIALVLALPFLARAFSSTEAGRRARRRTVLSLGVAFAAYLVWTGPIYGVLGVQRSNPLKEAISFPAVEVARVCSEGTDLSEQLASVGVDQAELVRNYENSPHTSDTTRGLFWSAIDEGKAGQLVGIWFAARGANPMACIKADLELTSAAWNPCAVMDGYEYEGHTAFAYDVTPTCAFAAWCEAPATQSSLIPWLSDVLWHISRYDTPTDSPLTFPLMSVAPWLWLGIATLVACARAKDQAGKVYCILMLAVALTMLLGPMVLLRYYLSLIVSAPVFVFLLVNARGRKDGSAALTYPSK